jgi:kynurenine formamidase
MTMRDWIDVSVPLRTGMVHWPDNPPVSIERTQDIELGDVANVSKLSMGAHTGTHMDASLHFFQKGKGIHTMPLSVGIDYLSVGGFTKDGVETHHALLEAGIWLIEGLNLTNIESGIYELICLPQKIEDADGSPARAILRSVESTAK